MSEQTEAPTEGRPEGPGRPELPPALRSRVLSLVAEVLPHVPGLSPALRKVAGFTPGRRTKLGSTALIEALEDEVFVTKAGVQASAVRPQRVAELSAGPHDPGPWASEHPMDAAALAWLVGAENAGEWLGQAAAGDELPSPEQTQALRLEVAELQRKLREGAREAKADQRAKVEAVRVENADLRRKLGEARAALRAVRADDGDAVTQAEQARVESEKARERLEAELRRARARIEELERKVSVERSEGRVEREDESVRARLLLDTLMDAASGLRRELALPPLTHRPADRIAEAIEEAVGEIAPTSGPLIASAVRLEQHLAAPGAHLVIDGYNVTRSVWEATSLETQRTRLLSLLPALAARTRVEVTVVFDAAAVTARPVVAVPRGVRVLFSPPQVIADDVIREIVAAEPRGRPVLVVTADGAVLRDVRADGALTVSPAALLNVLARDLR